VAWVSYLMLLYSLLCLYISGGADIFHHMLSLGGINIPSWMDAFIFTLVLGFVVYNGIRAVDMVNRSFMSVKMTVLFLLIALILPHIDPIKLQGGHPKYLLGSIMAIITSFGFSILIPSLRVYFKEDVKKLRLTLIIGTLIPLVIYILWVMVFLGVIPKVGPNSLSEIIHSGHVTSELTKALDHHLNSTWVTDLGRTFVSISVVTSFLGVALSMSDFLADGLNTKRQGKQSFLIYGIEFIPPLVIVLFYPGIFIQALSYAGLLCVILLALLPALMVWSGRYRKKIAKGYQVWGGKPALIVMIVASFVLMVVNFTY